MESLLAILKAHSSLPLAGGAGALIALQRVKKKAVIKLSKLDQVISVLTGIAVAVFMTPLFDQFLVVNSSPEITGGIAFVLGYMGKDGIELLLSKINSK